MKIRKKKFNAGIHELKFISDDSYNVDGINNIEQKVILNKTVADKNLEKNFIKNERFRIFFRLISEKNL